MCVRLYVKSLLFACHFNDYRNVAKPILVKFPNITSVWWDMRYSTRMERMGGKMDMIKLIVAIGFVMRLKVTAKTKRGSQTKRKTKTNA